LIHYLQSAAKINLTLRVTGRRPDGYHELRSIFHALPAIESLTIESDYGHNVRDVISVYGEVVRGKNILEDVLSSARKKTAVEPLRIRLQKAIPPGSGLGGGSGNAAALISWLNMMRKENEKISGEEIGSDVPFFLSGARLATVKGRGEKIELLSESFPHLAVLVVIPSWKMPTAKAFSLLARKYEAGFPMNPETAEAEMNGVLETLHNNKIMGLLPNDFCAVLLEEHPEYKLLFSAFEESGSVGWGITGSGSAAFGLFYDKDAFTPMIRCCSQMKWIRKILLLE